MNSPTCMDILRGRRSFLLQESDWTQMPDCQLTDSKKAEWATYRQALRDLPQNNPDPQWIEVEGSQLPDVNWPEKPE